MGHGKARPCSTGCPKTILPFTLFLVAMKPAGVESPAQELVRVLLNRSGCEFDFITTAQVAELLQWDHAFTVAAIQEASRLGWLRSFGSEWDPVGCGLRLNVDLKRIDPGYMEALLPSSWSIRGSNGSQRRQAWPSPQ